MYTFLFVAFCCYLPYTYVSILSYGGDMIISFCGHCSYRYCVEDENQLLLLIEKIAANKPVDFYLGSYGSFDEFAKNCAKKYKEKHANTKLIFVTPYLGKWLEDKKEYILSEYDEIIYPEIENTPLKFAIVKRNEWMVKNSDFVVAYVKNRFGGAYKTLSYAIKCGKPYVNIYREKSID